jgi:hypothetical protein
MQGQYAQGYAQGYGQGYAQGGYDTHAMAQPEYAVTDTSSYNTGSTAYGTYQDVYPAESYATDVDAAADNMPRLSVASEGRSKNTVGLVDRKVIISRLSQRLWTTPSEMHKMIRDKVSAAVEKDIVNAQPNRAKSTSPPRYSYSVVFKTSEAAREAVRKLDGLGLADCKIRAKLANEGWSEGSASAAISSEHSSKKSRSSASKDQEKREKRDKDKPIIADGSKHRDKKKSKSA